MERNTLLRVLAVFAIGVAFAAATSAQDAQAPAATGSKPNDVVVAVDVSGSMSSRDIFTDVKAYLERDLVRPLLKVGDRFTLIVFGESARALPTRTIASEADIDAVVADIEALKAEEDFTDLGSALETLDLSMASRAEGDYRPVAVFITDGKNAPPPTSPFSGKDLSVDDRFTESGRRIAKKGWFLYVVGLGEQNDAAVVAAAVEGSTAVGGASSTTAGASGSASGADGSGSGAGSDGRQAEALSAAPLVAYLEETAEATEERAVAAEAARAESASRSSIPVILTVVGGAVILAGFVLLIIVVRRRAEKKDDKRPTPKIPLV